MARIYRTPESYRQEVRALTGGDYEVVGEFSKMAVPIIHRHTTGGCGYEWSVQPNNFIRGTRCPKCAGSPANRADKMRRTHVQYVAEIAKLTCGDYVVLGEFRSVGTPILHQHNTCGYVWKVTPVCFVNMGTRCPRCIRAATAGKKRKSHSDYISEVKLLVGDEYEVLDRYVDHRTPIIHLHNCGFEWYVKPNSFVSGGNRCPRCNESKGERRIADVLDSLHVEYTRQFRFEDCRARRPLPFDVAVQYEGGTLLIEYDGEQHSRPVEIFGGDEGFAERQRNDRIKTEYCAANGIPLIRIPYWDFDNIAEILNEKLTQLNVSSESGNRSIAG